jgi:sigma-B regulation protein RsbU (phosphoserine phosphatase)
MTLPYLIAILFGGLSLFLWRRMRRARFAFSDQIKQVENQKEKFARLSTHITASASATQNQKELHEEILQAAIQSVDALSAALFLADEKGVLTPVLVSGLFPILGKDDDMDSDSPQLRSQRIKTAFQSILPADATNPVSVAATGRQPVLIRHGDDSPLVSKSRDASFTAQSLIAAPVFHNEKFFGVLAVANPIVAGKSFNETDCAVIQFIARQTGTALYFRELLSYSEIRKQLYADLTLASSIQKALLPPRLPEQPWIDMDAYYQSMHQIGGDFYYASTLPDGRMGAIIFDVSGKGVQAALLMAICRTHLSHLIHRCNSPADLLRKLSLSMHRELGNGRYITAICALIDPIANTLTLARAGHEVPLFYVPSADGTDSQFQTIHSEGIAIGLVPPDAFTEALTEITIPLPLGSILLFYTDGLTEARNAADLEYGLENVKQSIREHANERASELNKAILSDMKDFCGTTPLFDDLTLLTFKYRSKGMMNQE